MQYQRIVVKDDFPNLTICPYCGSDDVRSEGFSPWSVSTDETSYFLYRCWECGKEFEIEEDYE